MLLYSREVRRVLILALALNLSVVFGEIVAGIFANSLALISDGVHKSVDSLGNFVGLVVLRYSTKAPDEDHPYGHHKIETLAAFSIAGLLAISFFEIIQAAVGRLTGAVPPQVHITAVTIGTVLAAIAINAIIMLYERYQGKKLNSHFLLADAAHTASDLYISIAVLANVFLVKAGYAQFDSIFAAAVALLIAYGGYKIIRETVPILVDASALPRREVTDLVKSVAGVKDVINIRTRGWQGNYFIELTITSDIPDAREAHEITEIIESALRNHYGHSTITIHLEPTKNHS